MRTIPHKFRPLAVAFAVAAAIAAAPARAQTPQDASADAVTAGLARWQQAMAEHGKEWTAALGELAALDDPRVTRELLSALEHARSKEETLAVLAAIGQRVREDAIAPLRARLLDEVELVDVRAAAAGAIARQGNRGIDLLLEFVRADGDQVPDSLRIACARGLAAVDDARAWRGLAPLLLRGPAATRLGALRLVAPARGVTAVTQARIRLLQDTDDVIAATAWRQLAEEGNTKAASSFADLAERFGPAPAPEIAVQLIAGLGCGIPGDAYEPFLRLATGEQPEVQTAVRAVVKPLARDAAFVRWLVAQIIDGPDAAQRRIALAIIAESSNETVTPLLDRVRASLQKPGAAAPDLALAFDTLLAKDKRWPDDVRRLLGAPDEGVRTVAFALLFDLGVGTAIAQAQKSVAAKEWELRSVAYRYLTRWRALASIPILIARVEKEDGRLAAELSDALFAHTGVRCWRRAEWDDWWKKNRATHKLPAEETVTAGGRDDSGTTVSYYGIPLHSRRAIFLLDISGSMLQPIGTDKNRTRLDEAKRQLRLVVEQMPEDQLFNVMAYEGLVTPTWPELHRATPGDRRHVLDLLDVVGVGRSGTNIHDALELAFQDATVDSIYLLTDGEPTVGRLVEPDAIADQVRRWNYRRQIAVHCVALGLDSHLLRRLAVESGGRYVHVR